MNFQALKEKLLTANIEYEKYSGNYRRLILLNILLYVTMLLSLLFVFINIFYSNNFLLAGMDLVVFTLVGFSSYYVHTKKCVRPANYIFVGILFVFLISFSLVNQNENFGLIWTIFLPIVAILLLPINQASYIVVVFYAVLFYLSFFGIGVWDEGAWSLTSFLRFSAASLALSAIVYFMEYSHALSELQLLKVRQKEEVHIQDLRELSIRDTLTKLYNRRYLVEMFPNTFKTAQRHQYYFAFFIIDVDYFKQYNDLYGHQQGDVALCLLADALQSYMRRSEDFICRLGGEEFCGICVGDNLAKIEEQLLALLSYIQSLNIEHKASNVADTLTISMGVKIINTYDDFDFDRLYKEADEALYKAKHEGRNRIETFKTIV